MSLVIKFRLYVFRSLLKYDVSEKHPFCKSYSAAKHPKHKRLNFQKNNQQFVFCHQTGFCKSYSAAKHPKHKKLRISNFQQKTNNLFFCHQTGFYADPSNNYTCSSSYIAYNSVMGLKQGFSCKEPAYIATFIVRKPWNQG